MKQGFILCMGYDEILYPVVFTDIEKLREKKEELKKEYPASYKHIVERIVTIK
jgi:hypothetical protein